MERTGWTQKTNAFEKKFKKQPSDKEDKILLFPDMSSHPEKTDPLGPEINGI